MSSDDTERIELEWTGKTREAIESNLQALLEMGDVSRTTYEAFIESGNTVTFDGAESAQEALAEMEYIADMGHPEVHEPTLRDKTDELREAVEND